MKKLLLSTILLLGLIHFANAQDQSENNLGLRLSSNDGFGTEISYQRKLTSVNRFEIDLGWKSAEKFSAVKLTGLYQWIWNIDQGFNWYSGFGGGLGNWNSTITGNNGSGNFLYAAGVIGIEYNFDFPLQLSLDLRPEFGGNSYNETNFRSDLALGIRYKF